MIELYLLLSLMIVGSVVALEAKDLLSAVISLGIVGFSLVLIFLILQAPDLAIVQIVVETLTLVIMIAAILKTSRADTAEAGGARKTVLWLGGLAFLVIFMLFIHQAFEYLPDFGQPIMRMAGYYVSQGLEKTGAANLVAGVILDFRGYDTLGEATVLFTAVMGVIAVLRRIGRKRTTDDAEQEDRGLRGRGPRMTRNRSVDFAEEDHGSRGMEARIALRNSQKSV